MQKFQPHQHSQKLIQCLIKLEAPEYKAEAKMELLSMTGDLMPSGKPTFLEVIKYPMIQQLIAEHGKKTMLKVLFLLVKDFCGSLNVVRNMTEDQMIEAAAMLIDECGNFRIEDYVMMFSMAKKGELVKIYDRMDIQIITAILDEYWQRRYRAANKETEFEVNKLDALGPQMRGADEAKELKDLFHNANLEYYSNTKKE